MKATGICLSVARFSLLKPFRAKIVIYDLEKDVRYTLTQKWDRSPDSLAVRFSMMLEDKSSSNQQKLYSFPEKGRSYISLLEIKLRSKFGLFPSPLHPTSRQLILIYLQSTPNLLH